MAGDDVVVYIIVSSAYQRVQARFVEDFLRYFCRVGVQYPPVFYIHYEGMCFAIPANHLS